MVLVVLRPQFILTELGKFGRGMEKECFDLS